jgi:hypothetical protein
MRLPPPARAFLDGFALGGIFPSRRPSVPDYFFAQEDDEDDAKPDEALRGGEQPLNR